MKLRRREEDEGEEDEGEEDEGEEDGTEDLNVNSQKSVTWSTIPSASLV